MKSEEKQHGELPSTHPCSKVVFVTGAGHSGTTLLGMMLGAHPDALFAGEVQESTLQGNPICRTCGADCNVWSNIDTNKNVYDELTRTSGKPVVIDTSKMIPKWVEPAVASRAGRGASMIFVTRDPRAIVASELRKQPELSPTEIIARWRGQMRLCETLAFNFPGSVVRVQYEELATKPKETLQSICADIELPFEEHMLCPWDTPGHQLDGNIGVWALATGNTSKLSSKKFLYYINHEKKIKLDERWKHELDEEAVQEIREAAKSLFYTYGWEGYND
jgi:hypothetical protein